MSKNLEKSMTFGGKFVKILVDLIDVMIHYRC